MPIRVSNQLDAFGQMKRFRSSEEAGLTFTFPTSGNLLYLKGDTPGAGTTWFDQSASGYNATFVNSPTWDTTNGAVAVNGSGAYVNIAGGFGNLMGNRTTWSLEMRIQRTTTTNDVLWARADGGNTAQYGYILTGATGIIRFAWSGDVQSVSGVIGSGTTNSIIFERDNSTSRIYLDGNQVATGSISGTFVNTQDLRIGEYSTANGNSFAGLIFRVAFWNRLLTTAEKNYLATT